MKETCPKFYHSSVMPATSLLNQILLSEYWKKIFSIFFGVVHNVNTFYVESKLYRNKVYLEYHG